MNKQYIKNIFLITAAAVAIGGCKPEINSPSGTTHGSADFSRYIAVGNSLTAGYADGGLYLEGQKNSYPSMIAAQMASVGGGTFTQPLFDQSQANGSGYLALTGIDKTTGSPITANVTTNLAITGQTPIPGFGNVTTYAKYTGTDLNNYGVPGIKLLHITLAAYGNLNGFYERLLPGAEGTHNTTYLDFITSKPFTFFSNWLGNNDALGYATSGGAGDVLTDKTVFAQLYTALIAKMTAGGAKGVCATIPDVTSIPYFNTVTPAAILAGVQKANPAVQAIYINAKTTADASTTYAPRAAKSTDLIVLTFPTSLIGTPVATPAGNLPYGLTPYTPIDNKYVLDENEVAIAKDYVNSYNNTIKSVAASKGLAVADMYTFLNDVKAKGLLIDGVSLSSSYITGGLFSLDGVHLTPRGYAVVANQFIKAINAQYGSTIPSVNVSAYRGVKFPN